MNTMRKMQTRIWVAAVDNDDGGPVVTLANGWDFRCDPGCGVRGFATIAEAEKGTRRNEVIQSTPKQ